MPPTVILIRHAQALHNVDPDKCCRRILLGDGQFSADLRSQMHKSLDPGLTAFGRTQCEELSQHLREKLPADLSQDIGLIVCSAMKRTCETTTIGLDFLIEKGIPVKAHAGWQENSEKPCDTGSPVEVLKKVFPQINFDDVDEVFPSKTKNKYSYTKNKLLARAQSVLEELYNRPEKAVAVVSHSAFMRQCVTGDHYFNADYRIYDFEEHKDGDGEPYKLKQWDLTKGAGGMGRSLDQIIPIGTGLPETELPPGAEMPLPEGVKPN